MERARVKPDGYWRTMKVLNRRDFGKIALAGIPTAVAFAKINSTFAGVKIGAQSYSFRTMPLEEAIQAFVDCGIGECISARVRDAGGIHTRGRIAESV